MAETDPAAAPTPAGFEPPRPTAFLGGQPARTAAPVRLGATDVAPVTLAGAVDALSDLIESQERHLVVTPNVDHLVLLEHDSEFAAAYGRASLRVVDGAPLVLLARLLGTPVPGRIAGVDLTLSVLAAAERERRSVFFLGGDPPVLQQAMGRLHGQYPNLVVSGSAAPTIELEAVSPSEEEALTAIRGAAPDLLVLFLGAPKQEKWFWRRAALLPPTVALAVGGTVDLIAGAKRRAPQWIQSVGFEWLWRLSQEPGRLGRRYLGRDPEFLRIAARQIWARRVRHDVDPDALGRSPTPPSA
ncbi:MAG TPA: WecB/TagA/CpsF family glycosyltransferase [Acidimicrobiia bacterium]|nr:WecB/TagA/CpsF family glycosyltransferase [Acidimicrobiia bacterium]